MNPCSHPNTKPGTLFLLGDTWRPSYRCLDCGQTGEGFGPPGPDLWGAPRALRERPPRLFTQDEVGAFSMHWAPALDETRIAVQMWLAIGALRALFPDEYPHGYCRPVMVALAARAAPLDAMRAFWNYPKPDVMVPAQEPAEVR